MSNGKFLSLGRLNMRSQDEKKADLSVSDSEFKSEVNEVLDYMNEFETGVGGQSIRDYFDNTANLRESYEGFSENDKERFDNMAADWAAEKKKAAEQNVINDFGKVNSASDARLLNSRKSIATRWALDDAKYTIGNIYDINKENLSLSESMKKAVMDNRIDNREPDFDMNNPALKNEMYEGLDYFYEANERKDGLSTDDKHDVIDDRLEEHAFYKSLSDKDKSDYNKIVAEWAVGKMAETSEPTKVRDFAATFGNPEEIKNAIASMYAEGKHVTSNLATPSAETSSPETESDDFEF